MARDVEQGVIRGVPDVRARLDVVSAADRLADIVVETLGLARSG